MKFIKEISLLLTSLIGAQGASAAPRAEDKPYEDPPNGRVTYYKESERFEIKNKPAADHPVQHTPKKNPAPTSPKPHVSTPKPTTSVASPASIPHTANPPTPATAPPPKPPVPLIGKSSHGLRVSDEALVDHLRKHEEERLIPYRDSVGKITVGIGFNMQDGSSRPLWDRALKLKRDRHPDLKDNDNFDEILNAAQTKKPIPISPEMSGALLDVCVADSVKTLRRKIPDLGEFKAPRQLALVSMVFNLGFGKFSEFKQTLQCVKDRTFVKASHLIEKSAAARQARHRYEFIVENLGFTGDGPTGRSR